jgi:hypothetical protein
MGHAEEFLLCQKTCDTPDTLYHWRGVRHHRKWGPIQTRMRLRLVVWKREIGVTWWVVCFNGGGVSPYFLCLQSCWLGLDPWRKSICWRGVWEDQEQRSYLWQAQERIMSEGLERGFSRQVKTIGQGMSSAGILRCVNRLSPFHTTETQNIRNFTPQKHKIWRERQTGGEPEW